jgi:hypothetical protein
MRGQAIVPYANGTSAEQINPEVLEEVKAIQKAYEQSRGPSMHTGRKLRNLNIYDRETSGLGAVIRTWMTDVGLIKMP